MREQQGQPGANRPEQQRAHGAHHGVDFMLDVRLAHGTEQKARDDEPLKGNRGGNERRFTLF